MSGKRNPLARTTINLGGEGAGRTGGAVIGRKFAAWLDPQAGGGWVKVGSVTASTPRGAAAKIVRRFILRGRRYADRVAVDEAPVWYSKRGHHTVAIYAYTGAKKQLKVRRTLRFRAFAKNIKEVLSGRMPPRIPRRKPRRIVPPPPLRLPASLRDRIQIISRHPSRSHSSRRRPPAIRISRSPGSEIKIISRQSSPLAALAAVSPPPTTPSFQAIAMPSPARRKKAKAKRPPLRRLPVREAARAHRGVTRTHVAYNRGG
jgi:hypothetical protein